MIELDLAWPIIVLGFLPIMVGIILVALALRVRSRRTALVLALVTLILAMSPTWLAIRIFAPEVLDARLRVYKRFYKDIQPGMTRADVMALIARHYPPGGPRQRPKTLENEGDTYLGFLMNPERENSSLNAEGIFLTMNEGRVSAKTYSPD
jgi:hypothetical protein